MPEKELPIRIVREKGSQNRRTTTHAAKVKTERVIPVETGARKQVITHKANESLRFQRSNLVNRAAVRTNITDESLRRRRIAAGEQVGERRSADNERARRRLGADVLQRTGARPAAVGVTSGLIRVFVVIFLLSMLFLVVSKGQQAGNAIQKVGYFLNNLTSGQPLFKQAGTATTSSTPPGTSTVQHMGSNAPGFVV
jgi:hypothetical protein